MVQHGTWRNERLCIHTHSTCSGDAFIVGSLIGFVDNKEHSDQLTCWNFDQLYDENSFPLPSLHTLNITAISFIAKAS